ncbi:MAG: PmeII family type II restriction endonuclease [Pyrinomonadaceae bacterium]
MKKINLEEVEKYVEENISLFHKRRLEFVETKVKFDKILEQKNPYLFKAKNILTAQDLVKGFLDAFLQSQEEGLFGHFLEGLAIFVADKVYGAKKTDLVGMDLEFIKDDVIYVIEIKAGWNWGNASQIKQLKINAKNAKEKRERETGKSVKVLNGCCFGKKRNKNPEVDGYQKICGQEFWHLISNEEDFYIKIVEPIGFRAKERNEEFQEVYAILVNKFTLEFAVKFCDVGKINWEKLLEFNSGKKNKNAE